LRARIIGAKSETAECGQLAVPRCGPETITRLARIGVPVEAFGGEIRARWVMKDAVEAEVVESAAIASSNLLVGFDLSKETSIEPTTPAQFARREAAVEVMTELQMLQEGRMPGRKVVLVREVSSGLVGCSIISMNGHPQLESGPYIEAIARNDPYDHAVVRDCETSAGAITLRATVEAVVLEAGGQIPEMCARVRLFNVGSHRIFKGLEFGPRLRSETETPDVVLVRRAGLALPEPLGENVYRPLIPAA
jgi:hypothetical protein